MFSDEFTARCAEATFASSPRRHLAALILPTISHQMRSKGPISRIEQSRGQPRSPKVAGAAHVIPFSRLKKSEQTPLVVSDRMVSDRTWIFWAKRSSSSREISVCVAGRRVAGRLFAFLSSSFHHRRHPATVVAVAGSIDA
jgi:hypothetical protein